VGLKVFFIIPHNALLLVGSKSYVGERSQQHQHYTVSLITFKSDGVHV
jgi:hypothetical protein